MTDLDFLGSRTECVKSVTPEQLGRARRTVYRAVPRTELLEMLQCIGIANPVQVKVEQIKVKEKV